MRIIDNSQGNKETINISKDFLGSVLKEMMSVLQAECGSFFLLDNQNKELVLNSFLNSQDINIQAVKRRIGEGVAGKVFEISAPVLVKDIDRDPRFRRNGFNHYHTKSFISIPLSCSSGPIGLINIADKATGEPFSEKDLLFAVTLCKYACAVLDNMLNSLSIKEEKENLKKQKNILEKYASVGKLAAGIVHEINNPLDGIIRYTNISLNQIEPHSVVKEYLLEIKKGLDRIFGITKSLLEFSHLVNSTSSLTRRYVPVYDLIEDSLDVLKGRFNNHIRLVKKYNNCLPRILDMGLSHVLINIIKNALDAMPEGGELEIESGIRDSIMYISFKDTGIGMPEEIRSRIFEPFFSTKGATESAGLGLAICSEVINKYEGKIEVESSLGGGSTFHILIPKKYLENEQ